MKKLKLIEIVRVDPNDGKVIYGLSDGRLTTGDDPTTLDIVLNDLKLLLDRRSSQRQACRDYTIKLQKERQRKAKKK